MQAEMSGNGILLCGMLRCVHFEYIYTTDRARLMETKSRRLTEREAARIAAPASGYQIFYDADDGKSKAVKGFGLRVTAPSAKAQHGTRAFIFNYRFKGRSRRITIGKLGAWTVLAARKRAAELRRMVDVGKDPLHERDTQRGAPLMSELFTRYLIEHALPNNKLSSVAEDWSLIHGGKFLFDEKTKTFGKADKPFSGTLGEFFAKMQVEAVEQDDVIRFKNQLQATPYRANRALALLSSAMNLAETWKRPNSKESLRPLNSNPCTHVPRYKEKQRDRHLNDDELAALGKVLKRSDPIVAAAIRLLSFTGCRVSEILGLTWERIDTKAGIAKLEDAKAGARDVQLSAPALVVLSELPTSEGLILGDLTYTNLDSAWRRIRDDAGLKGARLHDLRHTAGTRAGASGANAFVIRDYLGHKNLSMTDRYVGKNANPVKQVSEKVSSQIAAAFKGEKADVNEHPKSRRQ
jgi:integrase